MAYSEDVNVNLNVLTGTMSGITAIMGGMSALTSSFGAMGTAAADSFGTLDGLLVSATALITTFAIQSAEAFGQYEQGMKVVQTVSGQANYAMQELGAQANQMAINYRTSINDITDGLQTLGRAGLNSINEQLEVLESGLQTAKLEGRNLNGVLEELIQNTAMLGGDLKSVNFGEQTEYLNTIMVGTSMTAPINSHDISQTLQYAGGTAAAAGANLENKDKLEDLMGTIAAFAQKGVKGSMSGTALRAFFTKPASQDKSVTDALGSIGLSPGDLWEKGGESMKKVSDQVGIIKNRMDALNLSTMDQVELWGKIVGPKMGQQMMKLDANSIKDLTRDIESASSAEELATQTLHTYTQQLAEMSEQGQLAYREFGEKVATYLQPVAWVITQILGLLSDPHVNFIAFATIGSVLAHGFRTAWNMISVMFGQIKTLIFETAGAIQNINVLAGGSAPGFGQSAEQVGFLNAKLHETDATLQAIQAKAMGIRPGYIMPGDHGLQMVPRGTLKAYEEDVVIDKTGNALKGGVGRVYAGQYQEQFKQGIKQQITAMEERHANAKIVAEEKIAAIQQKKANAEAIADESHLQRVEAAKNIVSQEIAALRNSATAVTWRNFGLDPKAQKQLLNNVTAMAFINQHGMDTANKMGVLLPYQQESNARGIDQEKWLKSEYDKRLGALMSQSATERKNWLGGVTRGYNNQIASIEEEVATSEKTLGLKKEQLKELEKQGITKVQTRMDMMSVGRFNRWLNDPDATGALDIYSRERTREMMKKHPELYEKYMSQGYAPAFISKGLPKSHPNMSILEQSENMGMPQAWIDADKARIKQQQALWSGETAFTNRAKNLANERMTAWSNAMNKGVNAMTSIPSRLRNIPTQWAQMRRDPGQYIQSNVSNLRSSAVALNLEKLNMAGMSASEALTVVSQELGLTRTELSMMMTDFTKLGEVTGLSAQEITKLSAAANLIRQKIIEATVSEDMDSEAAREHAMVMKEDIAAVTQHEVAMKTSSTTLGGVRGAIRGATSAFGSGISKVVGFMGGPFMAAMMGFSFITQQINEQQQKWQERMQEASNQLSEAKDKMSQASDTMIEEIYSKEYSNLSDADKERIANAQYATVIDAYDKKGNKTTFSDMYNNEVVKVENLSWTKEEREQNKVKTSKDLEKLNANAETLVLKEDDNIKALEENTAQVRSAAYQYSQALQKIANAGSDSIWGFAGKGSDISDAKSLISKDNNILTSGIIPSIKNFFKLQNEGFFDNNSPVLTESQADKNYSFGTDFASVFLANTYRFDVEEGLKRFYGNDYDKIISLLGGVENNTSIQTQYGQVSANVLNQYGHYFNTIPQSDAALALATMKDNPNDMSMLAKSMFRTEQQYDFKPGGSVTRNYGLIASGIHPDGKPMTLGKPSKSKTVLGSKDLKSLTSSLSKAKLTTQDKQLRDMINKFRTMTGNKLSEQTILMMGHLQMLSDMNAVAQEQIAPGVTQTVQTAGQIMDGTFQAAGFADSASAGAGSAAANAYAIAVHLQAQAQETATHEQYQQYLKDPNAEKSWFGFGGLYSEEDFTNKIAQKGSAMYDKYGKKVIENAAIATSMMTNPNRTYEQHKKAGENALKEVEAQANKNDKVSFQDMLNTVTSGLPGVLQQQIMSAYDQSDKGEYSKGAGGGSGSGSGGSGSDNKGDTGSTRNRVDLVLCNKKTIPKLNVNLFKKPPQFKINNKQFSIRDININTQDKPDAMVDAVKDGIVRTQQRMDPKIIQDEQAVYDPAAATDGTTPTGKTPVATK